MMMMMMMEFLTTRDMQISTQFTQSSPSVINKGFDQEMVEYLKFAVDVFNFCRELVRTSHLNWKSLVVIKSKP